MNIDQLLNLDKTNKMINGLLSDSSTNLSTKNFGLYDKMNSQPTNQIAFDFLSNYSNPNTTTNLMKTANQLGLNSNLIEHFLKTPMLKNESNNLFNPFNFPVNKETKKEKDLDENNYGTYFNRLLNQSKVITSQSEASNKKLDTNPSYYQHNQNLASAVTCYSNDNELISTSLSKKDKTSYPDNYHELNNKTELNHKPNRPLSQNSLNDSMTSTETDFDFNDSKNLFNSNKFFLNDDQDKPASYARMGLNGLEGLNEKIFGQYQEWAQRTYGDSAKTKTVTSKKYDRIVKVLNGEEPNNVENSKFRFWVKSKGFRLGSDDLTDTSQDVLYVPCIKSSVGFSFKLFFNIS